MPSYLDRPRRHRIFAATFRFTAFAALLRALYATGEDTPVLALALVTSILLLLAVLHDLVAAVLQMKTKTHWRTVMRGDTSITEGASE